MRNVIGILTNKAGEYLDKAHEADKRKDCEYSAELVDNAHECRRAIVIIENFLKGNK